MLDAVPTIVLLIFVYFFLKTVFFTPLEKVLKERDTLTLGARKGAQESLAAAERKQLEYQRQFAEARADVYKAQEQMRRQWLEEQTARIDAERARVQARVQTEKVRIAAEATAARENLTLPSGELAVRIADSILSRKAGSAA